MKDPYDAVVVGSGASGGMAAMKLTQAGLKVAVIEAGRALDPQVDFHDHTPLSKLPLRGALVPKRIREQNPIQATSYAFTEQTHPFFVNDREQPYVQPADKPFTWIRSRQVGGKTLIWGRVALRMSDLDFKAASRDGHGVDWPLTYAELAPYYDEVESFIGVSGSREGLGHLPDGQFLPPMQLSCGERLLKKCVEAHPGRRLLIARGAVLTQEHQGRAQCHYCGPCERGCVTGSYFSSPASTLKAASETGRLTLLTQKVVRSLALGKDGKVKGVLCVDARTGKQEEVRGRVFLLGASTLETTRILLNSRSKGHMQGLGNASGVLGRYLMDHVAAFVGELTLPALRGVRDTPGERPVPFYIPRFQNLESREKSFLRGYAFQGSSHDTGRFGHAFAVAGLGAGLKRSLQQPDPHWYLWLLGFGECLAYEDNHCRLDETVKDRFGIPALRIEMTFRDNEQAMMQHMAQTGGELLDGLKGPGSRPPPSATPGAAVHEVGTARMGDDPERSYLNRWNQSHQVKNLFVIDGAAFPSSPCQNPTLTIMALAARASDHVVGQLKRREL